MDLELFVDHLAENALHRLHYAIDLRAEADLKTINAMAVCRRRGLGQVFRHAIARAPETPACFRYRRKP